MGYPVIFSSLTGMKSYPLILWGVLGKLQTPNKGYASHSVHNLLQQDVMKEGQTKRKDRYTGPGISCTYPG